MDGFVNKKLYQKENIIVIAEYPRLEFNTVEVPNGYIDYEGLHIDYTKCNIRILNNDFLETMLKNSPTIVLSAGCTCMDMNRINCGNDVENLFIND
jgi:hypothetical protein